MNGLINKDFIGIFSDNINEIFNIVKVDNNKHENIISFNVSFDYAWELIRIEFNVLHEDLELIKRLNSYLNANNLKQKITKDNINFNIEL